MNRPQAIRDLGIKHPKHNDEPMTRLDIFTAIAKVIVLFIAMAVLGFAFFLRTTPALPVEIPVVNPKPAPPAPPGERPSSLGKHL